MEEAENERNMLNHLRQLDNNNGKILLRIIIVVMTLLFVGIALFGLLKNIGQKQQVLHRKALAVSEYGLMKALQKVESGIFEFNDIPKSECEEGWYSVSFKKYEKNDTVYLNIIAKGEVGSTFETRECTLKLVNYEKKPVWEQHQMR